jgi:hypothetical protein
MFITFDYFVLRNELNRIFKAHSITVYCLSIHNGPNIICSFLFYSIQFCGICYSKNPVLINFNSGIFKLYESDHKCVALLTIKTTGRPLYTRYVNQVSSTIDITADAEINLAGIYKVPTI